MKRFVAAVVTVFGAVFATTAQAQPPTVSYASPSGIPPGAATNVLLIGGGLAATTGTWHNIPGATIALAPGVEANNTQADRVTYQITVPPETPVGIYAYRVGTGQGVSSVRLLMVDDLPTVVDNAANKTVQTAQPITLPTAVDGTCEAESYDYYKLSMLAGQNLSVEVVGRRLGSALDVALRLLDANGRELAYSDDEPGIGADGRFAHRFSEAGDYLLEVRDIRYQGGDTHRYRLRLGDFPLVTTTYPLAAQKGASPRLVVSGASVEGVLPFTVTVPANLVGSRYPVAPRYAQGQGAGLASIVASARPEQIEFDPNDTPETASAFSLPGGVSGRFETAKDRDYYQFQGTAGQRWQIIGRTRSLNSPTDLFLRLFNADGGLLAEAEDAGVDEGMIDITLPADGIYRIMVEDLLRRGGPEYSYRIEAEAYQPGFSLAVEADKFDVPHGGVLVAKVTCVRRDYNGPITLAVTGAGEGLTLANNVIPEGQAEVLMSVTVPPSLSPGTFQTVNVVGTARIGEVDFTARASTLTPLRAQFSGLPYPPDELDGLIGLGIGPAFADFFQLVVDPVPFVQIAGTAAFPIKVTKLNGFDDVITLAVEGLPPGITATVVNIEKGQAEAAIQLAGPGSLAEGEYKFRVVGSAVFQNQPKRIVLPEAVLRVVKPLEVTAAPAGPLAPGGTQKFKITLARQAAAAGAVTIGLAKLPPGVTAPAEITIAEGANEIEIDLSATAEAQVGLSEIEIVATTTVAGKPVRVESLPVALQLAMP